MQATDFSDVLVQLHRMVVDALALADEHQLTDVGIRLDAARVLIEEDLKQQSLNGLVTCFL